MAGPDTWIKTGVEHARRVEHSQASLQTDEVRVTHPEWAHTMALFSMTKRWSDRSASLVSAEYLDAGQGFRFETSLTAPLEETLLGQMWDLLREDDDLNSTSWRLAKHYILKQEHGTLVGGVAWTGHRDAWRLAQTVGLADTARTSLLKRTALRQETGLFLKMQRMYDEWRWEGNAATGLLRYRLLPEVPDTALLRQHLPYLSGTLRLLWKEQGHEWQFNLSYRKNLPSSLRQLDVLRVEGPFALSAGRLAPLVQQQWTASFEWQQSRLLPFKAWGGRAQVFWGRNAWTPDIRTGSRMVLNSWIERPAPVFWATMEGSYEQLFESLFLSLRLQPSVTWYRSEEFFDGQLRYARNTHLGLKVSVRTGFDAPLNLALGSRFDGANIRLQPEGLPSASVWHSQALMTYVDLFLRPGRYWRITGSAAWFVMHARSGDRSRWLQIDLSCMWKPAGPWSFRLSANNLADTQAFTTFSESTIVQTAFSRRILPRYVLLQVVRKFSFGAKSAGE
ncbi:MAG: hypothetical protein D6818_10785 [Bacteroidetes bacterium]|nr:MAG: hypothetical protein D6818_10785 [Bacteroidota bacterium]